jgi:hypothetical protein
MISLALAIFYVIKIDKIGSKHKHTENNSNTHLSFDKANGLKNIFTRRQPT